MTKEEAIDILHRMSEDNFYGTSVQEACKMAVEALSKCALPSDLDEAAKDYQERIYDGEYSGHIKRYQDTFKAGAEWMAGQGVNSEGKVFTSAFTSYVKTPGIEELLKDAFPEDAEVIVQIRKK